MPATPKQHALAVLTSGQIAHDAQFDRTAAAAALRREFEAIRAEQGQTALRGLRLGIVLWCVKQSLAHGQFMPWVKEVVPGHYATAGRYMKLARYFVEKTGADLPEVLAIQGTQIELALDAAQGPQAAIWRKARKFIGEKSLTELLAEAAEGGAAIEPAAAPAAPIDAAALAARAREELSGSVELMRQLLLTDNVAAHLTREEIRALDQSLEGILTTWRRGVRAALK